VLLNAQTNVAVVIQVNQVKITGLCFQDEKYTLLDPRDFKPGALLALWGDHPIFDSAAEQKTLSRLKNVNLTSQKNQSELLVSVISVINCLMLR